MVSTRIAKTKKNLNSFFFFFPPDSSSSSRLYNKFEKKNTRWRNNDDVTSRKISISIDIDFTTQSCGFLCVVVEFSHHTTKRKTEKVYKPCQNQAAVVVIPGRGLAYSNGV